MFVLYVLYSKDKRQSQDKEILKKFPWGHGCLSFVSVVCLQVEVSATGRSLVQRS